MQSVYLDHVRELATALIARHAVVLAASHAVVGKINAVSPMHEVALISGHIAASVLLGCAVSLYVDEPIQCWISREPEGEVRLTSSPYSADMDWLDYPADADLKV